jgi:hypothetical protein
MMHRYSHVFWIKIKENTKLFMNTKFCFELCVAGESDTGQSDTGQNDTDQSDTGSV